jgi:beta-ribofuranosylaminobenzene 5'-phosphate synthase
MHGGSGRVDGGIGITFDEPGLLLGAELSPAFSVKGDDPALQERVRGVATDVLYKLGAGGTSTCSAHRSMLSRNSGSRK